MAGVSKTKVVVITLCISTDAYQTYLNNPDMVSSYQFSLSKTRDMTNKISKSQKEQYLNFIRQHFGKLSEREMARRLGIGKTTVNNWARGIGLFPVKHSVNEGFFDSLDEHSAYILGFIFADGNVSWNTDKGYYSMTITAAEKDKDHLEKIRELMQSTKPLLYAPKTKSYRLIVNSKRLCRKLMEYGVVPRKSKIVKFPQEFPQKELHHFIRGVIDGDGCVSYHDRKRSPYFEISIFSGSLTFCIGLRDAIYNSQGINANIRKFNKGTYGLTYSCTRGKKLAKSIYSNSGIFLERKHLVYKNNVLEDKK